MVNISGYTLFIFMALMAQHVAGDFVLQTHWQATNKSKNNRALTAHVSVYTTTLFVSAAILFGWHWSTVLFAVVNGILHWITDYFTSRQTSKFFGKQDWHNGFVVVGFDQFIHQCCLAATLTWIIGQVQGV